MKEKKQYKKLPLNKKDLLGFIIVRLVIVTALIISAVSIQFSTSTFLVLTPFYSLIVLMYILSVIYIGLYFWGKLLFYQISLLLLIRLLTRLSVNQHAFVLT